MLADKVLKMAESARDEKTTPRHSRNLGLYLTLFPGALYCGVVPYKIIWARRLSGPNPALHSGHGPARHFPARREHLFRACCLAIYSNATDAGTGATVRVICLVVLAGPSPATPRKGVSLHTWVNKIKIGRLGASAGPLCTVIYYHNT